MSKNLWEVGRRYPLTSFFVLAYAWTWLCWWAVVAQSNGLLLLPLRHETLAVAGQFGPFVAALSMTYISAGRAGLRDLLRSLVRWRAGWLWLAVSLFLLPATMLAAIVLYCIFNGAT